MRKGRLALILCFCFHQCSDFPGVHLSYVRRFLNNCPCRFLCSVRGCAILPSTLSPSGWRTRYRNWKLLGKTLIIVFLVFIELPFTRPRQLVELNHCPTTFTVAGHLEVDGVLMNIDPFMHGEVCSVSLYQLLMLPFSISRYPDHWAAGY